MTTKGQIYKLPFTNHGTQKLTYLKVYQLLQTELDRTPQANPITTTPQIYKLSFTDLGTQTLNYLQVYQLLKTVLDRTLQPNQMTSTPKFTNCIL